MSRSVLLVDPDIDALGELASELRARGLEVVIADGLEGAIDRARRAKPDVILLSSSLDDPDDVSRRLAVVAELAGQPRFTLVDSGPDEELAKNQLRRGDADAIAKRLYALPAKGAQVAVERGDFRGDVQQIGVIDLLQLLSMNRRTGALSITTPAGAGEVRLVEGEIVDAVFRRLEGEKALYRLLAETSGTFSFTSSAPAQLRRVQMPTNRLLMEGLRQIDEAAQRKQHLTLEHDALLAVDGVPDGASEIVERILEMLAVPRSIDELLDDLPLLDLDILEALEKLLTSGAVRRVWKGAVRVELAGPEQLAVIAAQVKRLARAGFSGPPRVVLTASPGRLPALMHSVGRIADAIAPASSAPAAPVPHLLATLRLTDGIELDVVGLPALAAFAPIWGLTLPGSMVVVSVGPVTRAVAEFCAVSGVPVLDAGELLGDLDEADPGQIAALLRMALESAAGR